MTDSPDSGTGKKFLFGVHKLKFKTVFKALLFLSVWPVLYFVLTTRLVKLSVKKSRYDNVFFVEEYNLSNDHMTLRGRYDTYAAISSLPTGQTVLELRGIERLLHQINPVTVQDKQPAQADFLFERFFKVKRKVTAVSCRRIFKGDENEMARATTLTKNDTRTPDEITAEEYINITSDCPHFMENRGYILSSLTEVEERFPIAFSILIFKDVWQFERLLRAIYRPQNLYCVHVDVESKNVTKEAVAAILNCFDNVFLASRLIHVKWGKLSVLEPELTCMQDLWQKSRVWKYFINLTGQEFPLRTNYELVQILTAYNGANDVESTIKKANKQRWTKAGTPPHGLTPVKGSVHIAASRGFVDSVLHDPKVADLLNWTRYTRTPDETFFATINHNPSLKVPGSYMGLPETDKVIKPFVARFKRWSSGRNHYNCSGKWVRTICIFGIGDLPTLVVSKRLIANKFYYNYQRFALDCMEELHFNRTRDEYLGKRGFDHRWYAQLGFVKNQLDL